MEVSTLLGGRDRAGDFLADLRQRGGQRSNGHHGDQTGHSLIPIRHRTLKPTASVRTLAQLTLYMNEYGASPTQTEMADYFGRTPQTVSKHLQPGIDAGHLMVRHITCCKNEYTLTLPNT